MDDYEEVVKIFEWYIFPYYKKLNKEWPDYEIWQLMAERWSIDELYSYVLKNFGKKKVFNLIHDFAEKMKRFSEFNEESISSYEFQIAYHTALEISDLFRPYDCKMGRIIC